MTTETLQKQLEAIDDRIVALLQQRLSVARQIGETRRERGAPKIDLAAEERTFRHVVEASGGAIPPEKLLSIYRPIVSACRPLVEGKSLTVACLGPVATFSHLAATERFGHEAQYELAGSVSEVFGKVQTGEADYGVVAVWNTIHGPVHEVLDLFPRSSLTICGEFILRVEHHLMARGEPHEIKKICSHPQALGQCREHLWEFEREHGLPRLEQVAMSSTSEAARLASEDRTVAALASRLAAEVWNLPILRPNMEDDHNNMTRFLILGRESCPATGQDRTSLWFRLIDQPGALLSALEPLRDHGINMTLILSRPVKDEPWAHSFFVDFEGHVEDEPVKAALAEMERVCLNGNLKILGSYPRDDSGRAPSA